MIDLETKSNIYAEAKIPEYWVVDLQAQKLIVFRHPQAGKYTSRTVDSRDCICPLAFPNLDLAVDIIIGT